MSEQCRHGFPILFLIISFGRRLQAPRISTSSGCFAQWNHLENVCPVWVISAWSCSRKGLILAYDSWLRIYPPPAQGATCETPELVEFWLHYMHLQCQTLRWIRVLRAKCNSICMGLEFRVLLWKQKQALSTNLCWQMGHLGDDYSITIEGMLNQNSAADTTLT